MLVQLNNRVETETKLLHLPSHGGYLFDKSVWLPYTERMDNIKNIKHKIAYDSIKLALAYVELDKKTRYYGTDVPIFYSEIHMIMVIAENPGIHVGGIADLLGITKGSVSEIVKKLEKKALVKKEIDEHNLSRYLLSLTEKGEKAHLNHMSYHTILNGIVEDGLQNATEHDVQFLSQFLSAMMTKLKNFDDGFVN